MSDQVVPRVEDEIGDMLVEVAKKVDATHGLPGAQRVAILDEVTLELAEALALIRTLRSMVIV